MKKILFSSAAALSAVVGFSSFKTGKAFATTLYYFQAKPAVEIAAKAANFIQPAQVNFLEATQIKPTDPCTGADNICVIAVTVLKVTAVHKEQLAAQVKNVTVYTKN